MEKPFCLVFLIGVVTVYAQGNAYLGCYRENKSARQFSVSPGNYDPLNLNPGFCIQQCAKFAYNYAGLYFGKFCFCSNTLDQGTLEGDGQCNVACSDTSSGKHCGSRDHNSVYAVPTLIKGLRVYPSPSGYLTTFQSHNFDVSLREGGDVVLQVDKGDGAGRSKWKPLGTFASTYTVPGAYTVTVHATDVNKTLDESKTAIGASVQAPAEEVSISCPNVSATFEEVVCTASVLSGSYMILTIDYGDSTNETFPIADALIRGIGKSVPETAPVDLVTDTSGLYVIPSGEFREDATITTWEFYASQTGDISLLVLTPFCTSGTYCATSNTCSGSCDPEHTCTASQVFCHSQSVCTLSTLGSSCTSSSRYTSGGPPTGYTIKSELQHTIQSEGYQFIRLNSSTRVQVSKGDIIGYYSNTGIIAGTNSSESPDSTDYRHNNATTSNPGENLNQGDFAVSNNQHLLRAVTTVPSLVKFFKTYEQSMTYNISLTVSNTLISHSESTSVLLPVQNGINDTTIVGPNYAATNDVVQFGLLAHSGEAITYFWDFGDDTNATVNVPTTTHTYLTAGEYNVSIRAKNLLTSKENTSTIIILSPVAGMALFAPLAVGAGISNEVWLNMTSGDAYTCDWTYSEGNSTQTNEATTPISGASVTNVFNTVGTASVIVNCSNEVSSDQAAINQQILEMITNLLLESNGGLLGEPVIIRWLHDTGTNVSFTLSFDGNPITPLSYNQTHLWGESPPISAISTPGSKMLVLTAENLVDSVTLESNYTIEAAIFNLRLADTRDVLEVGDSENFTVTVQEGTSVQIVLDYGDGTNDTYLDPPSVVWVTNASVTYIHTFNYPGNLHVRITASNAFNNLVIKRNITVLNLVENLILVSDSPQPFLDTPATVTFRIQQSSGVPPLAASIQFFFGDGGNSGIIDYVHNANYTHQYYNTQTYNVTANVSNPLNSMLLTTQVVTITPATELSILVTPPYVLPNETVAVAVKMNRGQEITIYWDFGDGTIVSRARNGTTATDVDVWYHSYSTTGNYTIEVTAGNIVGNTSKQYVIAVQKPVSNNITVSSNSPLLYPAPMEFEIIYPGTLDLPSDAVVTWAWRDGNGVVTETIPFSFPTPNPNYRLLISRNISIGDHAVNVTISNMVSEIKLLLKVSVYEEINNLSVTPKFRDSNGNLVSGMGVNQDQFQINSPVYFQMNMETGHAEEYFMEALYTNNGSMYFCRHTENPLSYTFVAAGVYEVNLTATNPFSTDYVTKYIEIFDGIRDIMVSDGHIVSAPGQLKTFNLTFGALSPESCMAVDFGDDGSIYLYGDQATCNLRSYAVSFYQNIALAQGLSLHHIYLTQGLFKLSLFGWSSLTETNSSFEFPISTLACKDPDLQIIDGSSDFKQPQTFRRGDTFTVYGDTSLNCDETHVNRKSWTTELVDPATGVVSMAIPITNNPSASTAILAIQAQTLEYGLYKFTYSVQMSEPASIFGSLTHSYIEITKSPIVPIILEGGPSLVTRGHGQLLRLEPALFSRDPDRLLEQTTFDSFEWFCKRVGESLMYLPDGSIDPANPTSPYNSTYLSQLITDNTFVDNGGCFSQGAGKISVPGDSDGLVALDTTTMAANTTYEFLVIIRKDTRIAIGTVEVELVSGAPPSVLLRCAGGGLCTQQQEGQRINPSSRLALIGECQYGCVADGELQYEWSMYYWDTLNQSFTAVNDFAIYTDGVNSKDIAIHQEMFSEAYSEYDIFQIILNVRPLNNWNNVGSTFMTLYVNRPPSGGSCSIINSGTTAVDGSSRWNITCPGWTDVDGISNYQFYAMFKDDETEKQLTYSHLSAVTVSIPIGPSYDNYTMDVHARIYDVNGAFANPLIGTIQVLPAATENILNIIDTVLNTETNFVTDIANSGDLHDTVETFGSLAAQLNSLRDGYVQNYGTTVTGDANVGYGPGFGSDFTYSTSGSTSGTHGTSTTDGTTVSIVTTATPTTSEAPPTRSPEEEEALRNQYEEERNRNAQVRDVLVNAVSDLTLHDVESVQLGSSTMSTLLHAPEEVSRSSQERASDSATNMVNTLLDLADDTPQEELVIAARSLLTMIGDINSATNSHLSNPLRTDVQSVVDLQYYDTDLDSDQRRLEGKFAADAAYDLLSLTNEDEQRSSASSVINQNRVAINKITEALLINMVAGENATRIQTPKLTLFIEKNTVNELANQTITRMGSSYSFPPWCDMVQKANCSNDEVVSIQVMIEPIIPFNYTRNAPSTVSSLSGALTLNFMDGKMQPIEIPDSPMPIEMTIPRDKTRLKLPVMTVHEPFIRNTSYDNLYYTNFNVSSSNASLHIEIMPDDPNIQLLILLRYKSVPNITTGDFDHHFMVPEYLTFPGFRRPTTIFLDNEVLAGRQGEFFIGVRQLSGDEINKYTPDVKPPAPVPFTGQPTSNYSARFWTSGCYFFSESNNDWDTRGCRVGPLTNHYQTQCFCSHLTTFAGGWIVEPNRIDFNYVFSNMDIAENPTIYATIGVLFLVYTLVAIWARYKDKKDMEKIGVGPLPDNDPNDKYLYEVLVSTGLRQNGGTDSKVHIVFSADEEETDVRILEDPKRKILRRGGVDSFLMAVSRPLGPLNYARVWHDNSGKGKFGSWYCKHIIVYDLQTTEKYVFLVNDWFAVEEGDGQVDRVIPVAGKEQLTAFSNLFQQTTQKNLGDGHLWFSVFGRPPKSRFTRLQRVSCCLSLLFVTMLANAMFYEKDVSPTGSNGFSFGPFSLSPEQISIGILSNLLVFPVNLLLVTLFRKSRPRKKRPSRIAEAMKLNAVANSFTDIKSKSTLSGGRNVLSSDSQTKVMMPETKLKKKKKKFELPWGFVIFAWMLLWASVLVSTTFVLFYGISFGDEKVKKWITSMVISFFTSIFLTQPIKVFLVAAFFSLVIKNPNTDEDEEGENDEEEIQLKFDEEWLHKPDPSYGAAKPRKIAYKPPDPSKLEEARAYRIKEMKMYDMLREILFYSVFLWLLMVLSYSNRDPNAYLLKQDVENTLVMPGDRYWRDFKQIHNASNFWYWLENAGIPSMRSGVWYNGDPPIFQRGYFQDRVSRIMGYATIRQLRVRMDDSCPIQDIMTSVVHRCNVEYSILDQEERTFSRGWTQSYGNETDNAEYTYTDSKILDGYPYLGELGLYSGGGYVVRLQGSEKTLLELIKRLESEVWIDSYTRAVFVEFTVYNAFINLFGVTTMIAEFPLSGGIFTSYRVEPVRLLAYMGSSMAFQLVCEISYVLFIVFFIIKEGRQIYKLRKLYFALFWSWIELSIIVLSIVTVTLYVYRFIEADRLATLFRESHGNAYMKFQYVAYWNEILTYFIGLLVFLSTVKFIKLLRFNKRISLLGSTLGHASKSLFVFAVMFGIVFFAFIQLFFLLLGRNMNSYATILRSLETSFQIILGKFEFEGMSQANAMAPIFFIIYVITVTFILISMFMSILNESFTAVKNDLEKQSNDYEMVDFVMARFKSWTGIGSVSNKGNVTPPTELNNKRDKPLSEATILEGRVNDFPETVERLLHTISKVYFEQDKLDTLMYGTKTDLFNKDTMKVMLKNNQYKTQNKYPPSNLTDEEIRQLEHELKLI